MRGPHREVWGRGREVWGHALRQGHLGSRHEGRIFSDVTGHAHIRLLHFLEAELLPVHAVPNLRVLLRERRVMGKFVVTHHYLTYSPVVHLPGSGAETSTCQGSALCVAPLPADARTYEGLTLCVESLAGCGAESGAGEGLTC